MDVINTKISQPSKIDAHGPEVLHILWDPICIRSTFKFSYHLNRVTGVYHPNSQLSKNHLQYIRIFPKPNLAFTTVHATGPFGKYNFVNLLAGYCSHSPLAGLAQFLTLQSATSAQGIHRLTDLNIPTMKDPWLSSTFSRSAGNTNNMCFNDGCPLNLDLLCT